MTYRADSNGIVLIKENVDFTTNGVSLFLAIPAGVAFCCTGCTVVCNTYTALSGGTITVGTSGGAYSDIVASANLATITSANTSVSYPIVTQAVIAPTGTVLGIQVTPLVTPPGVFTGTVTLQGFYF